jgi:hypothetical protein
VTPERTRRLLSAACALALVALALMVWSLFDPTPAPVVLAMSVGQVIGTLAFAAFLYVVAADLRARLATRKAAPPDDAG